MFGRVKCVLLVAAALSVAGCREATKLKEDLTAPEGAPPKASHLSDDQQATVKDALKALGRIEGAVKVGVTYPRYGELVGDARAAVDEAVRVLPSDYAELATALKTAVGEYKEALEAWGDKIKWSHMESEAEVRLQAAWGRAGKSLENARLLAEGKPAVKDPPKTVNRSAEVSKGEKPKKPEAVRPDPKAKKEPTAAELDRARQRQQADQLARARQRAEDDEPAIEMGPDRPAEVRKAAEALTRFRRARAVLERLPNNAEAESEWNAASDAWAKALTERNNAKTAAMESAVTEAKAKADREHPILKTGPAQDQIKSRTSNEKATRELTEAARSKVEADYDLPIRKGEKPK